MNRRQFSKWMVCAGGGTALPVLSQTGRVRIVGLIVVNPENDEEGRARAVVFRKSLEQLGWMEGRNVRLEVRWGANDASRAKGTAEELLKLRPDVIVVNGSPGLSALQQATQSVPIVFVIVTDPLGAGYVRSLGRPGANITGFSTFAPEIGGKWLQLLKELSPGLRRVACILDPDFTGFAAIWREIQISAPKLDLVVSSIPFREPNEDLEGAMATFAKAANAGIVVAPTAINNSERDRIIAQAARLRLPAVYPFAHFALAGGLLAYGFDPYDLFARSATYVDRILKGEAAGALPVQAPNKFELIVNLRTAKALKLQPPPSFLARADRVIGR